MHENKPRPAPAEFKLQFPATKPVEEVPAHITAASNNRQVLKQLEKGEKFCFEGTWGTAMDFYSWIKKQVNQHYPITDYASSRINRVKMVQLTEKLFIRIHNHHPDLAKAPANPWLREFYPHPTDFLLQFTDYLGMNGARQWYEKGILYPGLHHKIHPFYGTYFPTRTEHLELFDQWLADNPPFKKAMDMGTGCGVLTFYMIKRGINHITATDINPNALYSVAQDLTKNGVAKNVELKAGQFFRETGGETPDFLIFNPPWLPRDTHTTIDKAMYYEPGFFDEFFRQAHATLPSHTIISILFSDFAQAAGISAEHPIEKEISLHNRFILMEKHTRPIRQKPSPGKNWLERIRSDEKAELWILQKQSPKA